MTSTRPITTAWRRRRVDEMVDAYADWREECIVVQDAYDRWSHAATADRAETFAAYEAALGGEERASQLYEELVARVAGAEDLPTID
jgi:hypothetical protein